MNLEIEQVDPSRLAEYAAVPAGYQVKSILRVEPIDGGLGGFSFREEAVPAHEKDINVDGHGGAETWPDQFDISDWGIFLAVGDSEHVGGVAVATPHDGIIVTEGRTDTAALWDIRVAPACRRNGIGMQLLRHAAAWAREEGFRFLAIETTNVDVPACRLYAKAGAELSEIRRYGYEGCPAVAHEAMIVWRMRLRE